MNDFLGALIIAAAVLIGILLFLREFWCWYWKINEQIGLQKQILGALRDAERVRGGASTDETPQAASTAYSEPRRLPMSSMVHAAYRAWATNPTDAHLVDFLSLLKSELGGSRVSNEEIREGFPVARGQVDFEALLEEAR